MINIGCYEPMIRAEQVHKWKKAKDGHLYHPAIFFSGRDHKKYFNYLSENPEDNVQIIACGKCIGCRLDSSRNKANQGFLEVKEDKWENAWFITLTIDPDHIYVPEEVIIDKADKKIYYDKYFWSVKKKNFQLYEEIPESPWKNPDRITFTEMDNQEWTGTICRRDIQLFMKRLRKYFKENYGHEGIRVMYAGEYGETNGLPHYHIILYNTPFPSNTFHTPKLKYGKYYYYQNTILQECWPLGFSDISEASWNNIAYTARYITKKLNGTELLWVYAQTGHEKEFYGCSNKPGIGYKYYEAHKEDIYDQDQVLVKNLKGSHWVKPPKYFDTLLERENPEKWEEIQEKRRWEQVQAIRRKQLNTSLKPWEVLQIEHESKKKQTAIFTRNNESY